MVGWTDKRKTGPLYRSMLEAGATKMHFCQTISKGFRVTDLDSRVDARVVANADGRTDGCMVGRTDGKPDPYIAPCLRQVGQKCTFSTFSIQNPKDQI